MVQEQEAPEVDTQEMISYDYAPVQVEMAGGANDMVVIGGKAMDCEDFMDRMKALYDSD